ncbi:MAG: pre-peptidase C-terminal domain-containing protein [Chloroflexota bacterium]
MKRIFRNRLPYLGLVLGFTLVLALIAIAAVGPFQELAGKGRGVLTLASAQLGHHSEIAALNSMGGLALAMPRLAPDLLSAAFDALLFPWPPKPPPDFSKLTPENGATGVSTSPTLTWEAIGGEETLYYSYCIDTTNNDNCDTGVWTKATSTSYTEVTGLNTNTTYYWQVRASNKAGVTYANRGEDSWWSFTTFSDPPETFSKIDPLNGATGVPTNPNLSWETSPGATNYAYCIDAINNGICDGGIWFNTGSTTSVDLSGLSSNVYYYWQVRADNSFGSTYANGGTWWSFRTQGGTLPDAFSKISPANNATSVPTNPTLTWQASAGATSYDYCYDTTNNNACDSGIWANTGTSTSVALSGLSGGTLYYWQARANNALGSREANSEIWWVFTTTGITQDSYEPDNTWDVANWIYSGSPQGHSISPATDVDWVKFNLTVTSQVILETSGATNADTRMWLYDGSLNQIEYNDNNGTDLYSRIDRFCATDPLPAGTYYVKVDENGNDAQIASYILSLTATSCMPGAFGKISPANGASNVSTSPTLSWQTSSGATGYEYCYDTSNNNTCNDVWRSTAATSASLTGLTNYATYYWQVRATGPSGSTDADSGAWWSFTTGTLAQDVYEPDNTWDQASAIYPSVPQAHNISPVGDVDWARFTLTTGSEVILDTSGAVGGDTRMWLYNSNLSQIEFDDDSGTGLYSHIDRLCAADPLPAGTYYVKVEENGNDAVISDYQLSLTVNSCTPAAFSKLTPANSATIQTVTPELFWESTSWATGYLYCYDTTNNSTCDSLWFSAGTSTSANISGLVYNTTYYWQVRALNAAGTVEANNGTWWSFTTIDPSVDVYEPDNDWDEASTITPGSPQTHSIVPVDDVDWVTFTLDQNSDVTLQTNGEMGYDTRMWLYDSGLNEIEYNDDGGPGMFSRIDRICSVDPLPAGTYYVKVDELNNNNEIPNYTLELQVDPCASITQQIYIPFVKSSAPSYLALPDEMRMFKEQAPVDAQERSQNLPFDQLTISQAWQDPSTKFAW